MAYSIQDFDIKLDIKRVIGYRQFCNKIWNSAKFTLGLLGDDFEPLPNFPHDQYSGLSFEHKWMLSKLSYTNQRANNHFGAYEFGELANCLHNFWLHELCDVYLEAVKPIFNRKVEEEVVMAKNVLWYVLDAGMKLMHPLMPFITEELW
jgi:valyl-tRNA synthetase